MINYEEPKWSIYELRDPSQCKHFISKENQCSKSVRYPGCNYYGAHHKSLKMLVKNAIYTVKVGVKNNIVQDNSHPVQVLWTIDRGYSVFVKSLRIGEPIVFHDGEPIVTQ